LNTQFWRVSNVGSVPIVPTAVEHRGTSEHR